MAQTPQHLIIIGSGIIGLTLAVAAQARGYDVTVLGTEPVDATASGIAAGMIAPALEALGDPEPEQSYARLSKARAAWFDRLDVWPPRVQDALRASRDRAVSRYVWPQSENTSDYATPRLKAMGIGFTPLSDNDLHQVAADCNGVRLDGEDLIDAMPVLRALAAELHDLRTATVAAVTATSVTLATGERLTADAVIVAAGFASHAFRDTVPCLAALTPIKGHMLNLAGQGGLGVTRSSYGYLADYGAAARFGATMQFGASDLAVEDDMVADLKFRAREFLPALDTSHAVPRVGVRAATPDTWPLIGRDDASGVYVATGMRRNGYIFAPFAAALILDLIDNKSGEGTNIYNPNRFLSRH